MVSHIQVQTLVPVHSGVEWQIETLREVFNPCNLSNLPTCVPFPKRSQEHIFIEEGLYLGMKEWALPVPAKAQSHCLAGWFNLAEEGIFLGLLDLAGREESD